MTDEKLVKTKECYEHHMLLKGQLDRINHFLFGDPEHPDELTITAKVNLIFNILLEIKKWAIASVFTFAGCLIFLGSHFAKMDNIALKLDEFIAQTHTQIESLDRRLTNLETIIYNK